MIVDGVKINYGIYDQALDEDFETTEGNATASSESDYSEVESVFNNSEDRDRLVYAEQDYFLLNGSFTFPVTGTVYNVGWESADISDGEGNISEYVIFAFTNTHSNYGVKLDFPTDCPIYSFKITYYDGTTEIGSETIDNTEGAETYSDNNSFVGWNRIRIDFYNCKPYQRARLINVYFGINDTYTGDTLIAVSGSRKTDITGDYSDCGEFSFTFYNNGRFMVETIKDLPTSLQEGLGVNIYIKEHGESTYKLFGSYYTESTTIEERGKVLTISGYDLLYRLNDTSYTKGVVYLDGRSLGAWAEDVAEDAGVTIVIDESFYNKISTGYITEVSHREALRLIAEAGNGILYVDTENVIHLIPINTTTEQSELTEDEIVDNTLSLSDDNKYLGVSVSKYTFSAASSAQELGYYEEISVTGELQMLEITYSAYPAVVSTVQVFIDTTTTVVLCDSEGNELTRESGAYKVPDTYSDKIVIYLKTTSGDTETTFLTITGTPYNSATTTETRGSAVKNIKSISNNYLITGDLAASVADYQEERVINKYNYSAEAVTDKNFELGDRLNMDDNAIFVTGIAFNVEYGVHEVTIEGIDE